MTLQIDEALMAEAVRKADKEKLDLNIMVENFIRRFLSSNVTKRKIRVTPFVESLGVDCNLPSDYDEKNAYREHLSKKYR